MKTFKEFIQLKEAPSQMMMQQPQTPNPMQKMATTKDLQALLKTPPPPGMNPQQMQQNVRNAINIAKNSNVNSAASAMSSAKALNVMQQPQ